MCVPSIRKCFYDLDEWNPEIRKFSKIVVFIGEFDKNELPAGPKFNVVEHTQDLSHYTFWTEYTDFGNKWILSPYILWIPSPKLKSRTIFKVIYVKWLQTVSLRPISNNFFLRNSGVKLACTANPFEQSAATALPPSGSTYFCEQISFSCLGINQHLRHKLSVGGISDLILAVSTMQIESTRLLTSRGAQVNEWHRRCAILFSLFPGFITDLF